MKKQGMSELSNEAVALACAIGALSKAIDHTGATNREAVSILRAAGAMADVGYETRLLVDTVADLVERAAS